MHIRCPHCHHPVDLVEEVPLGDVTCPSCGSHFSLLGDRTASYHPGEARTIGHFELIDRLGMGQFGSVWMARDTELDRKVAIKIPRKDQLDVAETEQFLREARAAAQLRHPNIVGVHEVGREGDTVYIVSDLVREATLADWLTGQRLTPREAAQLCVTIAAALHHAHDAGVIHRDLKPSNIMIDAEGQPHVMDFGLAKREAGEITMTLDGRILGTPAYMSPEQARGEGHAADRRSDIYSLGVVLFELLTGELPFRGNTRMLLMQILNEEPPSPRKLDPGIPRDLETICLKCLRKEPDKRYANAAELADDLSRFMAGEAIRARPLGSGERALRWVRRRPTMAAMIGVTAVAVWGSGIAIAVHRAGESKLRAVTLAESVIVAPAEAIPYALATLRPMGPLALKRLRGHVEFANADPLGQLHAAYALADLGQAPECFLFDAVTTAPDRECRNLVTALEHVKVSALPEIARREGETSDPAAKVRYAIIALQLGDPQPATDALAVRSDPIHRTTLIHAYAGWHGDLSAAAELLRTNEDSAFRSGLCAALGTIAAENIEPAERDEAVKVLMNLYLHAPDGGTHAAAGWALRQWKQDLPAIAPESRPPSDRRSFINGQGMTMVELASGKFTMGTAGKRQNESDMDRPAHEVTLTRPFYLGDREVTVAQLQRFVDDDEYPAAEKPQVWEGAAQKFSPTADYAVDWVSWFDAVLYCNWLSTREGRKPCYARTAGEKQKIKFAKMEAGWHCDFAADGYRLPTEAEWEYAARAGSSGDFCFGSATALLVEYAWFLKNSETRSWPGGQKLPNAFGLFDTHGNVLEWCWDWYGSDGAEPASDPTGPDAGHGRVLRGGAYFGNWSYCRSAWRSFDLPRSTSPRGFRVLCGQ